MLDGMSIDQLRTFIAAVDEGSFSAAGRKLRRAQSVVSATLANLESQVGFPLFERTGRYPKLTEAGAALLEAARHTLAGMDAFKAKARIGRRHGTRTRRVCGCDVSDRDPDRSREGISSGLSRHTVASLC